MELRVFAFSDFAFAMMGRRLESILGTLALLHRHLEICGGDLRATVIALIVTFEKRC